jgi:hypothetical protein
MAQHPGIGGIDGRGTHQVGCSLCGSAGSFEQTGDVTSELRRKGLEIAGRPAV